MNRNAYWIMLFILFFSPLAFGTVERWSLGIAEISCLLALTLMLAKPGARRHLEVPGILPLLLFISFVAIQLVPMPAWVLETLSPETLSLYLDTAPAGDDVGWSSITIHKRETLFELIRLASCGALYVVASRILKNSSALNAAVTASVLAASLISFLGILQLLVPNGKLLWFREVPAYTAPFGTFVNRNHFAGFIGMVFPLSLALMLSHRPRVSHGMASRKVLAFLDHPDAGRYILLGFSCVMMGASVLLSLSRAGAASICLSMLLFVFLIRRRSRARTGAIVVLVFLAVFSVGWLGWGVVLERIEQTISVEGDALSMRPVIWHDAMRIVADFPLLGTGLGTFGHIYPEYRSFGGTRSAMHAHNDYIELLASGGVVGFAFFGWFILSVLLSANSSLFNRDGPGRGYFQIAALTGLAAVFIHGLFDFNLQIGANGFYFSFLLGILAASSSGDAGKGKVETKPSRLMPLPVLLASGLVLALTVFSNAGALWGKALIPTAKGNRPVAQEDIEAIVMASRLDPLEAKYPFAMAKAWTLLGEHEDAARFFERALALDPANSLYQQGLGLEYSRLGHDDAARRLIWAGVKYDPQNPAMRETFGAWLLSKGEMSAGMANMSAAIAMEPAETGRYITLMVLAGLDDRQISSALPPLAEPRTRFAEYLHNTGRAEEAEEEFLLGLQLAALEPEPKGFSYIKAYWYYMSEGRREEALNVMLRAVEALPDNPYIRHFTGDTYHQLGMKDEAALHYRAALEINPNDKKAKSRLQSLIGGEGK